MGRSVLIALAGIFAFGSGCAEGSSAADVQQRVVESFDQGYEEGMAAVLDELRPQEQAECFRSGFRAGYDAGWERGFLNGEVFVETGSILDEYEGVAQLDDYIFGGPVSEQGKALEEAYEARPRECA